MCLSFTIYHALWLWCVALPSEVRFQYEQMKEKERATALRPRSRTRQFLVEGLRRSTFNDVLVRTFHKTSGFAFELTVSELLLGWRNGYCFQPKNVEAILVRVAGGGSVCTNH